MSKRTVEDAKEVLSRAKQATNTKIKGKTQRLIDDLSKVIQIPGKVIEQTEEVNKGNFNLKDRVVSIFFSCPADKKGQNQSSYRVWP